MFVEGTNELLLKVSNSEDKSKMLNLSSIDADENAKDNDGDMPLHKVSHQGHTEVLKDSLS